MNKHTKKQQQKLTLCVSKGDKGILSITAKLNIGHLSTITAFAFKIVDEQIFWRWWILGQLVDQDCAALRNGVYS